MSMAERARREPAHPRDDDYDDKHRGIAMRDTLDRDLDDVQAFCRDMGERIKIDKTKLDDMVEWQVQAVRRIGDVAAIISSQRDEAKDDIKVVEADVDSLVRANMQEKLSETAIKMAILKDRKYQTAVRKHAMLVRDAARLTNLRDAYKDRSYMVREMVTLFTAGYFADTSGRPRNVPPYGESRRETRGRE
jgi:hypothetical protein